MYCNLDTGGCEVVESFVQQRVREGVLHFHAFRCLLAAHIQPVVLDKAVEDCGQIRSQLLRQHVVENVRSEAPADD